MRSKYIQYYVEGEDEERLINVLKTDLMVIRPGKVQKFNVVEREFTNARLRALRPETMVVLVFDTDTVHQEILNRNLEKLKKCRAISQVVTIPQVQNLEEELVRSCNIRNIKELLNSASKEEFKTDFIRVTNLASKLREHQFDINRFWSSVPVFPYENIENQAANVKLLK